MRQICAFLLTLFISTSLAVGQINMPALQNADNLKDFSFDSSINKIVFESKITILFRIYSALSFDSEYRIISYGNDSTWHYNYFMSKDYLDSPKLFSLFMPQETIKKLWRKILKNKLFNIETEKQDYELCDGMISDSHHYEFIISCNGKYKKISYYDPEYFKKTCPHNDKRVKIIKCAKAFKEYCERPYEIIPVK